MAIPHSHKLSVRIGLKNLAEQCFGLPVSVWAEIYYHQCGQILRCKHFKNIHDGPEEGGIFNLSLFHTKKNEVEFCPTKSINQTNNFFTSLGSHNERKVGNNFLKRGESE